MSAPTPVEWELDYRPRKLRRAVVAAAVVVFVLHVVWGLTLAHGDVGVAITHGDQFAYFALAVIWAGLILTLLKIRVRAGAQGVEITGPLRARLYPWDEIVGFTLPGGARWPRLELPAYEHVYIWAIQTSDADEAVAAMRALREIAREYKPSAADPESVADR